ncbi:MAG: hypothetical protein C5B53_00980 [Candidatus Melainabacteria bacterium]|nr:MAG: hypothetical protein C5B53_00980 [Candidatus Melainabacteria bacterium]
MPLIGAAMATAAPKKFEVDLDSATPLPLPTPKFELKATVFRTPDSKEGWVIKIPGNRPIATPAYWEGMLFVGGGYGSHEFYAFDAESGRLVWQYRTGDDGPTAAVVEDGFCVFNTESCTVYVLDAKSGKLVWQQWLGDPLMSQPAVANGRLFIAYPGGAAVHPVMNTEGGSAKQQVGKTSPPGHRLLCADLRTGKHIWDQPISADVISAPVVDGDKVYTTCFDGTSFCFQTNDGKLAWKKEHAGTSAPLIANGQVIVTQRKTVKNSVYEGLAQMRQAPSYAEPASSPIMAPAPAPYLASGGGAALSTSAQASLDASVGFGGGAPSTAEMAKAKQNVGVGTVAGGWAFQGSRAAFKNGAVMNAQGAQVQAVANSAGAPNWQANFRGRDVGAGSQVFSPPALGQKGMYLTSASGHLVAMDQKDGRVNFIYATKQPMSFQPALAHGNVYMGTSNGLVVCIKTGGKDADGWSAWGGNAQHNKKD